MSSTLTSAAMKAVSRSSGAYLNVSYSSNISSVEPSLSNISALTNRQKHTKFRRFKNNNCQINKTKLINTINRYLPEEYGSPHTINTKHLMAARVHRS
jgi:hypothetical protein